MCDVYEIHMYIESEKNYPTAQPANTPLYGNERQRREKKKKNTKKFEKEAEQTTYDCPCVIYNRENPLQFQGMK